MPGSALRGTWRPGRSAFRGMARLVSAVAWIAAAVTAALLALFLTATVMVVLVMALVLAGLAGAAVRARRTVRAPAADANLIEARRMGGHSWVAYGWDGRR